MVDLLKFRNITLYLLKANPMADWSEKYVSVGSHNPLPTAEVAICGRHILEVRACTNIVASILAIQAFV